MGLENETTRRTVLKAGAMALALCALPAFPGMAEAAIHHPPRIRRLSLRNLHTDEHLHVAYWREGSYDRRALASLNHFLRDFRSGDVRPMSRQLMDLVHDLQGRLEHDGTIEVISGYRSPRTNRMLADYSGGVAQHSYHMRGMAMDVRLPGVPLSRVHTAALAMRRGGVGYYPDSGFVHVDVGPLRRW